MFGRRFHRVLLILSLCCCVSPALGQRSFARFNGSDFGEDLVFDTNELPVASGVTGDLNFSPNVVYSPDSTKAFVSFTASNKVAVFDPHTGDLIELVEVRTNPTRLTLTPDGKKVAVPCTFLNENVDLRGEGANIGAISIIDVETLAVQNIDLQLTIFSVMNNIVFSPDSSTGFVASTGTDEILRFDVNTASEVGERIAFEPGTRPAVLTMSEDGSFFGAVLVGSPLLPRSETPDSIQIIDTQSFQIQRSLAFTPDDFPPPPNEDDTPDTFPLDFVAANNVVFSPDGKLAFIADSARSNSSGGAGLPGEFIPDRALVIDMESGELRSLLEMGSGSLVDGGASRGSYLTPDGRFFITLPALNICVFEIESEEFVCIVPPFAQSQYRPGSRPAFTNDGVMFLASPLADTLFAFRPETAEIFNAVGMGGAVERTVSEVALQVPAAPLDVSISPDESVISTVLFNANAVELFQPTFGFAIPHLVADKIELVDPDDPDEGLIPLSERFFSSTAVSNFGATDADVIFEARGTLDNQLPGDAFLLNASPNPIQSCDGAPGQTTLSWSAAGFADEIEVRIGSATGTLFTLDGPVSSKETGAWVTNGLVFFLLDAATGDVLDTTTVFLTEVGCPQPAITAIPNPAQVCEIDGMGRVSISWDSNETTDAVEIRVGSAEGELLTEGGDTGSFLTGQDVTDGMVFVLVNANDGTVLDTVTVSLTDEGCIFTLSRTLQVDQSSIFVPDDFLPDDAEGNFAGWLDVDSDVSSLAGVYFTFDLAGDRLDGGPISSRPLREAIFPEIRIKDGFSTQLDIVNPSFSQAGVLFDLFDLDGQLVETTFRSIAPRTRLSLSMLGDPTMPSALALFDGVDRILRLQAVPNPIQVCDGATVGMTTLSWNVTGLAEEVEVRIGSADGELVVTGDAVGSEETGEWVTDGMVFLLIDVATRDVLDTLTVTHTEGGCPPPLIFAVPNPIPICDGTDVGVTAIVWDSTDFADQVEIRVDAPDGTLMTNGSAVGRRLTGQWVTDGMEFFLVDASDGSVLDSISVAHTLEGCPLGDFEDGYLRAVGSSFVSFERYSDGQRMAVLEAQDPDRPGTEFTVPHFSAFAGSDTILKLIYPSSIPFGGVMPEEDDETDPQGEAEEEEAEPMRVTLSLRTDDGGSLGDPVLLELQDGESRRESIISLFGLEDTGTLQSGWIDIRADMEGLVGSAEFQIFDGQAVSAVPLQAAVSSNLVYPHVTEGFGFSTGLAVLNSGTEDALVTIELRTADGQLAGTVGPVTIEAGNRLVGLIGDLFPGVELSAGTVKVLSDQPLTSLELYYSDDFRVLSAVPSQSID